MSNTRIKLIQNQDLTLSELYEQFQNFNKAKNLSEATIRFYEQPYKQLIKYKDGNFSLSEFNEQFIFSYINYLKEDRKLGDIAINSQLRGIRAMANYGMERGYIKPFKIRLIKASKAVKPTYSEHELQVLLKKPDMGKTNFSEYRNWVLQNFLIGTGARCSTICEIKIRDLDISNGEIILRHMKNRKQLIMPLSSSLKEILIEYIKHRGGKQEEFLFCNINGERLTPNALKFAIRRYNQKRGIPLTSLHAYRHTYAKMFILAGGDAFRLQRLLGHSSITMTMEYVNLFGKDLAKNYDKYCPLEGIIGKGEFIRMKSF